MPSTTARPLAVALLVSAVAAGCGTEPARPGPAAASAGSRLATAPASPAPKPTADAGDVQITGVPAGVGSLELTFVTGRGRAIAPAAPTPTGMWCKVVRVLPTGTGQTEAVPAGLGIPGRTYPPGDVTVTLWPSKPTEAATTEAMANVVPIVAEAGQALVLDLSDFGSDPGDDGH